MKSIYHNQSRSWASVVVWTTAAVFSILVVASPYSSANDQPGIIEKSKDTISNTTETIVEKSSDAWDATKKGTQKVLDKSKEVSDRGWDTTKQVSNTLTTKTKNKSAGVWSATKEGTKKAVDKSREVGAKGWKKTKKVGSAVADFAVETYEKTKELVMDDNQEPAVKDKSI